MNTLKLFIMVLALTGIVACGGKKNSASHTSEKSDLIEKTQPEMENGLMTPEVLWAFGRINGMQVSPDGEYVLFGVTYYNVAQNKGNTELFVVNTDGSDKRQITKTTTSEFAAKWLDSEHIAFISTESGEPQLWVMDSKGGNRKQISEVKDGISDFMFSPDKKMLLYIKNVPYTQTTAEKYSDLPLATGKIVTDLMYKHWDEWVEAVPHPFLSELYEGKLRNDIDLLAGEPYESPMKPWGGIEQLAWSPDGKTIAYTCRKKTGKNYAISTNSDIYFYNIKEKKTENKTEGMMGYDQNPVFSPDGKYLAWESMERDGYEADKNRLFLMNIETGEKRDLTAKIDRDAAALTWVDSENIHFISSWHGTTQVYSVNIKTDSINQITNGQHDYLSILPAANCLIGVKHSISKPDEIYKINTQTGAETEISFENTELLKKLKMGEVKEHWCKTVDGKDLLSWVIYPPDFDANKKYPTLLFCEGGPQSTVSQFWSYRWNFQIMAANGYIVIAPNRRGVPGFGQQWKEQISGDYGGLNMDDYFSAIDDLSKEEYVDTEHIGCVGASYGGFSVYWLAGHHNKRFKAFIAHDGMFNLEQQYLETEEMWFVNWDLGGNYWEKNNKTAQKSYANSPHLFVDKWDTPILVIHGEKDYRILASQGMAAFNAAVLRGVPAEMLIFPDENHWVLKPQNGILWQRTYFEWLDKWLK